MATARLERERSCTGRWKIHRDVYREQVFRIQGDGASKLTPSACPATSFTGRVRLDGYCLTVTRQKGLDMSTTFCPVTSLRLGRSSKAYVLLASPLIVRVAFLKRSFTASGDLGASPAPKVCSLGSQ